MRGRPPDMPLHGDIGGCACGLGGSLSPLSGTGGRLCCPNGLRQSLAVLTNVFRDGVC